MKKALPVLLMIWPYLFFCSIFLGAMGLESVMSTFLIAYIVLTIPLYIANIINAFTYQSADAPKELAFYDMLLKLIHIPFYIGVFAVGVMLALAIVVPALIFVSPVIIGMLFLIDALLMVTTSMYGVSAAIKGMGSKQIEPGKAAALAVFHFVFVTDVICAVILNSSLRKRNAMMPY